MVIDLGMLSFEHLNWHCGTIFIASCSAFFLFSAPIKLKPPTSAWKGDQIFESVHGYCNWYGCLPQNLKNNRLSQIFSISGCTKKKQSDSTVSILLLQMIRIARHHHIITPAEIVTHADGHLIVENILPRMFRYKLWYDNRHRMVLLLR